MAVGLRKLLNRRRKRSESETPYAAVWASPAERKPLTPERLKDLEAAWVELNQAVEESGAISFHACTRDGRYWGEDPESVRAMAATIRSLTAV
ncbi:hypothetical protein J2S98_003843 [Arthrobacter oryzae]|nr:hypothetical protein [Arthrobacter oryzae]